MLKFNNSTLFIDDEEVPIDYNTLYHLHDAIINEGTENNLELCLRDKGISNIDDSVELLFKLYGRIDLSSNNLISFPNFILEELNTLTLDDNELTEIPIFRCKVFHKLSIKNNKIKSITNLNHHPLLKELHLSRNKINNVRGVNFNNIKYLYLDENRIVVFSNNKLYKVKNLDLSKNMIYTFNRSKMNNVNIINLSHNRLTNVYDNVVKNVTKLYLCNNNLKYKNFLYRKVYKNSREDKGFKYNSDTLREVAKLYNIKFKEYTKDDINNYINNLIREMAFKRYKTKDITSKLKNSIITELTNIKDSIDNNEKREMILFKYGITKLMESNILKKMSRDELNNAIRKINDEHLNEIIIISVFDKDFFFNVKNIVMTHNNLERLPNLFLPKLKKLNVSHNNISFIENHIMLKNVKCFNAGYNNLSGLLNFSKFNFCNLNLESNRLEQIPILNLKTIKKLNLSYNSIMRFNHIELESQSLVKLDLSNNILMKAVLPNIHLEILQLNNNVIKYIQIHNVSDIKYLDIRNNDSETGQIVLCIDELSNNATFLHDDNISFACLTKSELEKGSLHFLKRKSNIMSDRQIQLIEDDLRQSVNSQRNIINQ